MLSRLFCSHCPGEFGQEVVQVEVGGNVYETQVTAKYLLVAIREPVLCYLGKIPKIYALVSVSIAGQT